MIELENNETKINEIMTKYSVLIFGNYILKNDGILKYKNIWNILRDMVIKYCP